MAFIFKTLYECIALWEASSLRTSIPSPPATNKPKLIISNNKMLLLHLVIGLTLSQTTIISEEQLIEKIKASPPDLQKGVLNFVEMLSADHSMLHPKKDRSGLFGSLRGKIVIKEGFDDPLEGMEEYM